MFFKHHVNKEPGFGNQGEGLESQTARFFMENADLWSCSSGAGFLASFLLVCRTETSDSEATESRRGDHTEQCILVSVRLLSHDQKFSFVCDQLFFIMDSNMHKYTLLKCTALTLILTK